MGKLNRTARIKRHSRIQKQHLWDLNIFKSFIKPRSQRQSYYGLLVFVVIFLPLYPSFSNVGATSQFDFDRSYIDENSIVESYYDEWSEESAPIVQSKNSFISINTIIDAPRDLSGTNEIIEYEIQSGDSISLIAYRFNVSNNTIYWANDFSKSHVIRPWDIIKIPPVSWLLHTIASGDTLPAIAKKYDIEEQAIASQNLISDSSGLIAGKDLVIPGAIKRYVAPVIPKSTYVAPTTSSSSGYSFAAQAQSQYVNSTGKYKLVYRKPYSWAPWNCTWYVASYKWVDWRWNANQWIKNARAKWHEISSVAKIGSIVQFEWRGYNPYYGHVAIVIDVTDTHIVVSDMNYRRKYEVTTRKVPRNDRTISGYIYID